jgi:hypothetical protein
MFKGFIFDLDGTHLQEEYADDEGKLDLLVSKDNEYYLTVFADDYLPESLIASASSSVKKIEMRRQTEENSAEKAM